MAPGTYTWLPVATAVQQLAQRLNDPNMNFWVYDELLTYISTSLRQFNSLTWMWRADFQYNDPVNIWNSLGSLPGSPRLRTITDVDCYTEMEYMLLELPSGGTWTGTSQFNISVMSQALQRRRDEIIQLTNCNQFLLTGIPLTPNTIRTELQDNIIDVERVRYMTAGGAPSSGPSVTITYIDSSGSPVFSANSVPLSLGPLNPGPLTITVPAVGQELLIGIVQGEGDWYYTGPASNNLDSAIHAELAWTGTPPPGNGNGPGVSIIVTCTPSTVLVSMNAQYGSGPFTDGIVSVSFGGCAGPQTGVTLYRDDTVAQEFYEAPLYQLQPGIPQTFSLSSEPPLSWQVDIAPAQPGTYEAIVLQSGAPFNPPTPTLVGIPDDLVWVLIWGALADLLGQESESTDHERAAYCLKRYQDGIQLMLKSPWIMLGKVNNVAVSLDSIVSLDRYDPEWDSNPSGFGPVIVVGGQDFIGAPVAQGIGLTVLGNAPIVDAGTGTWLQVSRSDWDCVILLAQARAAWKQGGAEFKASLELEKAALQMAAAENTRLRSLGAFSDVIDQRGNQQERDMNRFNNSNKGK